MTRIYNKRKLGDISGFRAYTGKHKYAPSVKRLQKAFAINEEDAIVIREVIHKVQTNAMQLIDAMGKINVHAETERVDMVQSDKVPAAHRTLWNDIELLYLVPKHGKSETLIYDVKRKTWHLTSLDSYMAKVSKMGRKIA